MSRCRTRPIRGRSRQYPTLPTPALGTGVAAPQDEEGAVRCAMSSSDPDRPPVLAHQRFVDDRKSFADLNLAQRFRRIHDTNMWGAVASASGLGSELDATAVLRAELPRLFGKLSVTSLLDAPCGDAGWINSADLGVRIAGIDIVPSLIESLQARAAVG